ncbi:MAG: hypothetical protein ACKPFA_20455, partial [Dolichospermum sp.]
MINDIDNPSEIELIAVQEYFIDNASQLVVIDDISNDGVIATPNETITNEPALLAAANKSELVANTANSLGIELSTTEIDHIADNFDNSSDDFSQTLEQVKLAIISYVQHKVQLNNQQITDT